MRCAAVTEESASSTATAKSMQAAVKTHGAIGRFACAFCGDRVVRVADKAAGRFMIVSSMSNGIDRSRRLLEGLSKGTKRRPLTETGYRQSRAKVITSGWLRS